jgi:HrpA-like RNA helicase
MAGAPNPESSKKRKLPVALPRHHATVNSGASAVVNPYQASKKQLAPIRKSLPVYSHRTEILTLIRDNQVLLVVAETVSESTSLGAAVREH